MTPMNKSILAALCVTAALGTLVQVQAQSDSAKVLDDKCWSASFSDDFNSIDFWNPQTNKGQWKTSYIWGSDIIINNELQYYIDPQVHGVSPFSTNDGVLNITADRTPESLKGQVKGREYVSGVLTTENGFSQKYGRFEAMAKVPDGKGLWSAFWLLPSFDQWPEGVAVLPEIDVMENLGNENNTYHTTVHSNQNGKLESHPYDHTFDTDLTKGYHLYTVVWTPEKVDWYFDKRWVASHETPADFTRPVHFLLNLAVGGTWPGNPDSRTNFPATYSVDYVRAYTDNGTCG